MLSTGCNFQSLDLKDVPEVLTNLGKIKIESGYVSIGKQSVSPDLKDINIDRVMTSDWD